VDLGFEADRSTPAMSVQSDLLQEALSNLIDNALRHTGAGGRVTVWVERIAAGTRLRVTDNGSGIPDQELPKAAKRFFRASNAVGTGAGLGLAIVSSIAKRHGGRLVLEREPNEGGLSASIELLGEPITFNTS
jgi:signal transduction histidine kinase